MTCDPQNADSEVVVPDRRTAVGRTMRAVLPREQRGPLVEIAEPVDRQSLAPMVPLVARLLRSDGPRPTRVVWSDPTGAAGSVGIASVSSAG
jgi:hypothetical protein